MRRSHLVSVLALSALIQPACTGRPAPGQAAPEGASPDALPTIESEVQGLERLDGFLPLYWDEAEGRLWLEVPETEAEFLYVHSLASGIGSNDIGLDRNQLGRTRVVEFERAGRKLFLVQPNYEYRASSPNQAERRSVEDAFARSILWGFEVVAESDGRLLVDATDFVLRDVHGVAEQLERGGQGRYTLDRSRSAIHGENTKAFPRNTEVEVILTFEGDAEGGWIRSVTPTPEAVTVRQRHSFVASPPPGYEPRRLDPRAGYFGVTWLDYSAPLGEPMAQRFLSRHRLEKRDPSAAMSEPVEPIVYYLDPGVPEPVRSALLEGASWWNQAFEAAGYRNAFRVEMLPGTADPLDVRYNVINWVHRSTRGWSYGSSVTDPRTGEIIKGHVLLGSLRVRQDYLLAEGLTAPYVTGEETPTELGEMALARIRQLSAHEVGHTLGLAHNFVASTADRASVMDYPHPRARLRPDGSVELADAYDTGIGEWDRVAIRYGYADFPAGMQEQAALEEILETARDRGLVFLSDQDARPAGSAHPHAHLWDNGADAAAELERVMRVRRAALDRFGLAVIRSDEPLATLEEALVPLYLHHRYQVEAATKVIGGKYYSYALRGDGQVPLQRVPGAEQRAALEAVLSTLSPSALALPPELVDLIPPRPYAYPSHRELFDRYTGITFDPIAPAAAAAELTLDVLLNAQRAARLVEQAAFDPRLPGLQEVLDRLGEATFASAAEGGYQAEVKRVIEDAVVRELVELAGSAPMPQVRAMAGLWLRDRRDRLAALAPGAPVAERAHALRLVDQIDRFLERPAEPWAPPRPVETPPGSPIGAGAGAASSSNPINR